LIPPKKVKGGKSRDYIKTNLSRDIGHLSRRKDAGKTPKQVSQAEMTWLETNPAAPVTMAFLWWSLPMPKLLMVWTLLVLLLRELLAVLSPILT
jgi:hypothetical protein